MERKKRFLTGMLLAAGVACMAGGLFLTQIHRAAANPCIVDCYMYFDGWSNGGCSGTSIEYCEATRNGNVCWNTPGNTSIGSVIDHPECVAGHGYCDGQGNCNVSTCTRSEDRCNCIYACT